MKRRWLLPAGLFLACVVPVLSGAYRGTTIVLEGAWAPELEPARIDRLPLFLHVVGSAVYYVLSALQILPGFRARHPVWHRKAGKVALCTGLIGAISSVWMTIVHFEVRGSILRYGRLLFGPLWALFLVRGMLAVLKRDFKSHGAWMIRAFAVAMPAGTLVFIFAPFFLILGEVPQVLDEALQSCAWFVHLAIAELLIRRGRKTSPQVRSEPVHRDGNRGAKRFAKTLLLLPRGRRRLSPIEKRTS